MCGIVGIISLDGGPRADHLAIRDMADAITHRGPDEEGFYAAPGISFGARRLSIVGLADGQQPVANEDATVHAVFNGELFDYPERKRQLVGEGHQFRTGCDTELLPHMWEEHAEGMFERLRGQFAVALHDTAQNRVVIARDRFGICPLYWTICQIEGRRFLLFGSEIKALLASGMVDARPDIRGIDQAFSFFANPAPVTCFEGVRQLKPGHFLRIDLHQAGAEVEEKVYWEIDFPDAGQEDRGGSNTVEEYAGLFEQSVKRRLRADVPVVSYLSGGVDSSWVLAKATGMLGRAPETFTLQIRFPGLDEAQEAGGTAASLGSSSTIVPVGLDEILGAYPQLIEAAECPVSDTVSTALLLLARTVHERGYKVALTGEGSDEMLAGYFWFKLARLLAPIDALGFSAGNTFRRGAAAAMGIPANDRAYDRRVFDSVAGANAWLDVYGLTGARKHRFYGPRLRGLINDYVPYADLGLNVERMQRWHPFNRSLLLGQRIHLSGLLLSTAGDRVAMHSSVETRYPFLDEDLCEFSQKLHPSWKLRGLREKYLLRSAAQADLPKSVAWRPKKMLRADWNILGSGARDGLFSALLSEESLGATGYFDPSQVSRIMQREKRSPLTNQALAAIATTQLWHHMFIEDLGAPAKRLAFKRRNLA